jgi:hypothetical protein
MDNNPYSSIVKKMRKILAFCCFDKELINFFMDFFSLGGEIIMNRCFHAS